MCVMLPPFGTEFTRQTVEQFLSTVEELSGCPFRVLQAVDVGGGGGCFFNWCLGNNWFFNDWFSNDWLSNNGLSNGWLFNNGLSNDWFFNDWLLDDWGFHWGIYWCFNLSFYFHNNWLFYDGLSN